MMRPEIEKLLGGYATGTLTPEERRALFAAALEDQELFDTLAREQALRDLLAEPEARARLLKALGERRPVMAMPWWRRPAVAAMAAGVTVAAVALTVVWPARKPAPAPQRPVLVAQVKEAPAAAPAPPIAEPKQVASTPAGPRRHVAAPRPMAAPPAPKPPETAVLTLPEAPSETAAPRTFSFRSDALERTRQGPAPPPQVRIGRAATLVKAEQGAAVLRYTVLRAAADGAWLPLEGATVSVGEAVRFRVDSQEAGRVQLIAFDAAGKPRIAGEADARPDAPCELPLDGLRFDTAGRRQFLLRLTGRTPDTFIRILLDVVTHP